MRRILKKNVVEVSRFSLERSTRCRLNQYLTSLFPGTEFKGKPTGKDKTIRDFLKRYEKIQGIVECVESDAKDAKFNGPYQERDSHINNIEAFCGKHKDPFIWNRHFRDAKKRVIKTTMPRHPLEARKWSSDKEVLDDLPKKDTHAGFEYLLAGKKEKGEYAEGILSNLCYMESQALSDEVYNIPHICGPRYQWRGGYDDLSGERKDWKNKNRTIWIEDIYTILTELRFSKMAQWHFGQLSCYAGGKTPQQLFDLLNNFRAGHSRWVSIDYSKYDQSIPGWLIREAFDVIHSWFRLTPDEEKLWVVVVNTFVHKSIVGPDGELRHIDDGVPSGSMFTQLIDSIVNMLMIETFSCHKGRDIPVTMNICGDDNLVFHDGWLDLIELSSYLKHNFGITMSPDKCDEGGKDEPMMYLSRAFTPTGVYRHPKALIAHMMFPEHFRDYRREEVTPEQIFFAYYLAYPQGMEEAFDISKFKRDYGNLEIKEGSRALNYLPGLLRYQIRYEGLWHRLTRRAS